MIARQNRFHGLGSLRPVYQRGVSVRSQFIVIKFMPNSKRTTYRCAVVVSKKVHKSAVVRNRIRRRIYECIRLHDELTKKPYDIVISVFDERVATMEHQELAATLSKLLSQAKLL